MKPASDNAASGGNITSPQQEEAKPPHNRQALFIIVVLLALVISVIGGFSYYRHSEQTRQLVEQTKYRQEVNTLIQSDLQLQTNIKTGLSYMGYTRQLAEIFANAEPLWHNHSQDPFPPTRQQIRQALDDYLLARECWEKKLANRLNLADLTGIDSKAVILPKGDPLYERLITTMPTMPRQGQSTSGAEGIGEGGRESINLDIAMQQLWQRATKQLAEVNTKVAP